MTLWKVHDEATRELVVSFYRRLIRGEARGEAMRGAQLEMVHRPERHHPYYWASFIILGDASPLPFNPSQN
jgi:CHAT domain-containing protein